VLVAPLIGRFDTARIAALSQKILAAIAERRTATVIFDITGVDVVDQRNVAELLDLARAVRLLGADTVIVGVRHDVALALVEQEIDLSTLQIYPNLQEAVQILQAHRAS